MANKGKTHMTYERPSIEERQDLTAQLAQLAVTSGTVG
jgi:hypothetical protein